MPDAAPANAAETRSNAPANGDKTTETIAIARALAREKASRFVVGDVVDGSHARVRASDCDAKRAIHVVGCKDSRVTIDASVECAKVFVERCEGCEIVVAGRVLSEHLEIWDCVRCEVRYESALGTTQIDQCRGVRLKYAVRAFMGAVVFATSVGVDVAFGDFGSDAQRLDSEDLAPGDHREIPQFITRVIDGDLLTERLIRGKDEYPTTERELRDSLGDALAAEHLDTAPARAELRKDKGNAAFKDGNYSQAVLHYTEALDLDASHVVALCNRAQCFLKLGEHDKALADADAALSVKPDYVKAHFRRGLALHALKRFTDAVLAFERTLSIDPKNIQAKDALRVAEYAVDKARRASRS